MSTSGTPLQQLVLAARNGDLAAALAALADGAAMTEHDSDASVVLRAPLVAAVESGHRHVVVRLLSLGADPNTGDVMHHAALYSAHDVLQALVDAGGDVNQDTGEGRPVIFQVLLGDDVMACLRLLLAEPALDLAAVDFDGNTADQAAREQEELAAAELIRNEVRRAPRL